MVGSPSNSKALLNKLYMMSEHELCVLYTYLFKKNKKITQSSSTIHSTCNNRNDQSDQSCDRYHKSIYSKIDIVAIFIVQISN